MGIVRPGKVPINKTLFIILSACVVFVTTLNASGLSFFSCTKAGCLIRLPPNSIRLPIADKSRNLANSVLVKGAVGFTLIINPNHEHSVVHPVESQVKPEGDHEVACVGNIKSI